MPVVDGFLLHQKIRRTDSSVKICFLTASEYFHEQVRKEEGFDGFNQESFLRKPIEINGLIHTTNKLWDLDRWTGIILQAYNNRLLVCDKNKDKKPIVQFAIRSAH
jgi:CheY-like chemotaxis protein